MFPGDMKRRASSAAGHRRPFWAKNEKTHQVYIDNVRGKARSGNGVDYGVDNFSYDEEQLKKFSMPDGLAERLPPELLEKTQDFQMAGAALCTALDRTHESYKNAMYSAYPNKSYHPCNSHEQAVVGAEGSPVDSPICPTPLSPITVAQMERLTKTDHPAQQTRTIPLGMESPPYTPLDSKACSTPEYYAHGRPENALPDLARINSFDEISWDHYLKHFDELIRDDKFAFSRVKGYGKSIEIILRELAPVLKPEIKLAVMAYGKWFDSMKPKVRMLEERVKALDAPNLRHVTIEWEMARAASMGMTHSGILESE